MKKIVNFFMITILVVQLVMPTVVYGIEATAEQVKNNVVSSTDESTVKIPNVQAPTNNRIDESTVKESSDAPIVSTDENKGEQSRNSQIQKSQTSESSNTHQSNAPPYEEEVTNERKEGVQVDFSIKGPETDILSGADANFTHRLRITGPETIIKDVYYVLTLKGLKEEKITFDSSKDKLEQMKITDVTPEYSKETNSLVYYFSELKAGQIYQSTFPISSELGTIRKENVSVTSEMIISGQSQGTKRAEATIVGGNPMVVKKQGARSMYNQDELITWNLDVTAPKSEGIIYFQKGSKVIVTDILPENMTYDTRTEPVGIYDAATRKVTWEFDSPTLETQKKLETGDNLLQYEEVDAAGNKVLKEIPSIKLVTRLVSGNYKGARNYSNKIDVNSTDMLGKVETTSSKTTSVSVVGNQTDNSTGPGSGGTSVHRGPDRINPDLPAEQDSTGGTVNSPGISQTIFPGDRVRFFNNVNYMHASSRTIGVNQLRTQYTVDATRLRLDSLNMWITRGDETGSGQRELTPNEYLQPTYQFNLNVNGTLVSYTNFLNDFIKNKRNFDTNKVLYLDREILGLEETDVISYIDFRVENGFPLEQLNINYDFVALDNPGDATNIPDFYAYGTDSNGKIVSKRENNDSGNNNWARNRTVRIVRPTDNTSVTVDNYIEYLGYKTGQTVKAGDNTIRATVVTGRNQPAYRNAVTFILLPIGTVYDKSKETVYKLTSNLKSPGVEVLTNDYNNSGRQMLRLNWNGDIGQGEKVNADIPVKIDKESPSIMTPKIFTYADNKVIKVTGNDGTNGNFTDIEENTDKMDSDYPENHPRIKNDNVYYSDNNNNLKIKKEIKGAGDTDFSYFSEVPLASEAQYRVRISNDTGRDFQNIAVLDVLPSIDDLGITDNITRGSKFEPTLTGPIEIPNSWKNAVTVSYSESKNPKRSTILYNKVRPDNGLAQPTDPPGSEDAQWTETPRDYSKIHSIKIELKPGYEFADGQNIELYYNIKLPDPEEVNDKDLDHSQEPQNRAAWNSVAVVADGLSAIESLKVGVSLDPVAGTLEAEKYVYNRADDDINGKSVSPGQTISYEIVAKNNGVKNSIVNNVVIEDTIPEGLTYVPGSLKVIFMDDSEESLDDNLVNGQKLKTQVLGSLTGGQEFIIVFDVIIDEGTLGDKVNVAVVSGTVPPKNSNGEEIPIEDNDNTLIGVPAVSLTKLVNDERSNRARVGDILTYKLVANHTEGPEWTGNLIDELSEFVEYIPGTTQIEYSGENAQLLNDTEVWSKNKLMVSGVKLNVTTDTAILTFQVKILEEASGRIIRNVGNLETDTPDGPKMTTPPVTTEILEMQGRLEVKKDVYKDDINIESTDIQAGNEIEYRIIARNTEDKRSVVNNIIVKDKIPSTLTYIKGTLKVTHPDGFVEPLQDKYFNGNELTTKNLGRLYGNEELVVSFKVKVDASAEGELINVAVVEGTVPPKEPDVGEDDPLPPVEGEAKVNIPADVTIEKKVNLEDDINVHVGDIVTYQIDVRHVPNTGRWTGTFNDILPKGVRYVPGTTKQNLQTLDDSVWSGDLREITVKNLSLDNDFYRYVFTFDVVIEDNSALDKKIVNYARAIPNNTKYKIHEDSARVNVVYGPGELTAEKDIFNTNGKSINNGNVKIKEEVEYRIKVSNTENPNTIINNVIVKDKIPEGLIYQLGTLKVILPDGKTEKVLADKQIDGQKLVTENLGHLIGGESLIVSFLVKVSDKAEGALVNIANAEATIPLDDPNTVDESGNIIEHPIAVKDMNTNIYPLIPGELSGEKEVFDTKGNNINQKEVKIGDEIRYSIRASNIGKANTVVHDIKISDVIPEGLEYNLENGIFTIEKVGMNNTPIEERITLHGKDAPIIEQTVKTEVLGELKGGEKYIISFNVKVTEKAKDKLTNIATIEGTLPPTEIGGKETPTRNSKDTTIVAPAEIEGTKTVSNEQSPENRIENTAYVGQKLTYKIKYTHKKGTGQWEGSILDELPSEVTYVPNSTKINGQVVTDDRVSWQDNTLRHDNVKLNEINSEIEIIFDVIVDEKINVPRRIINTAKAVPDNSERPVTPTNETITNLVPSPGRLATKKAVYDKDGKNIQGQAVRIGDVIEYRIEVTNIDKPQTIINKIIVNDEIPDDLIYVKGTLKHIDSKGQERSLPDEQVNGQVVTTENLGSLRGQESLTVSFRVKVATQATGERTNIATVEGTVPTRDPNDPSKQGEETPVTPEKPSTKIEVPAAITGEKFVNGAKRTQGNVGEQLTYRLVYSHVKDTGEWRGTIKDTLPSNVTYQSGTTKVNGKVQEDDVWNKGQLIIPGVVLNNEQDRIEIEFQVIIEASGLNTKIENQGTASPDKDPKDPNTPKEVPTDKVTTDVVPGAGKIETTKGVYKNKEAVDGKTVNVGDILEYQIHVKNTEAAQTIVNNIRVTDDIPKDLIYESGSLKVTLPTGEEKSLPDEQVNGQVVTTENLGSLRGQESLIVSFRVKVATQATGERTNIATVEGTVPTKDPNDPSKQGEETPVTPEKPSTKIEVPAAITGEKFVNGAKQTQGNVGEQLTYRLVYSHVKDTGEWRGTIKDTLPSNVTYQSGTTKVNGKVQEDDVWNKGQLIIPSVVLNNEQDRIEIEFQVIIEASGLNTKIENQGTASPDKDPKDPNTPKEVPTDKVTTDVVPGAGKIETTKGVYKNKEAVDGKTVNVGDVLEYQIHVKNTEAAQTIVNNIRVTDDIPKDLIYESGSLKVTLPTGEEKSLSDEQVNGQVVTTENLGSLRGQESLIVSFRVKVATQATGERTNIATVEGTVPTRDPNDPSKQGEETPVIPEKPSTKIEVPAAITGEKFVRSSNQKVNTKENIARIGETLTYTIAYTHEKGTGQWSGFIQDTLPEYVTYVPNSTKRIYNPETKDSKEEIVEDSAWKDRTLTVNNVILNEEQVVVWLTFEVTINKETKLDTKLKNRANATPGSSNNPEGPNIPTDETTTTLEPSPGRLEAEKSVYSSDGQSINGRSVKVGDVLEYRIKGKNTEAPHTIVNNVKIIDNIPSDLIFQPGSLNVTLPDGEKKVLDDEQVVGQRVTTESFGSLRGGESLIVSFKVIVAQTASGERVNVATIEGTTPPKDSGNPEEIVPSNKMTTDVAVPAEITAEKFVSGGSVTNNSRKNKAKVGDTLTYTLVFKHIKGTGEWRGQIVDQLYEGLNYVENSTKVNDKVINDDVWKNNKLILSEEILNNELAELVVTFEAVVGESAAGLDITNIAVAESTDVDGVKVYTPKVITKVTQKAPVKLLPKTGTIINKTLMIVGFTLIIIVIILKVRRKQNEKSD
ncbi:LPXTG cell wall anchor domain-containing protein [Enterococcus faecalis]|uniref:LPXTG cell wall anchor domain-containing protein n=2 Tax=Enterococcus faecalis TaxID=1351 RepID=UPI00293627F6|nr:LPXTG cell wall anchor domain-containing protein [Enterococcus faecalis]MDV2933833.1 LPXTG cell wall anchor domain-containing protein [Enterococcus faecalis]